MQKTAILAAFLAIGLAPMAGAALAAPELSHSDFARSDAQILRVGEGCGANRWRDGRSGQCRLFRGPGGSYRGTTIECPPGWHIGPGRGACWPN